MGLGAPFRKRWRLVLAGGLFCLTVTAYLPALSAGFVWDDDAHVLAGSELSDAGGLRRIWFELGATQQYYPVVYTSFWIEQHLWGSWPGGYHLINVFLHAATAVLLGLLLERLSVRGAWLGAALFALHPVHVESVAWISERKNVLSAALYLLSMLSYLRFRGVGSGTPRRSFYALALFLFLVAVLSKTVVASLPAAVLLLIWWKDGRVTRADVAPLLPFFAIGASLGLLTMFVEKQEVGAFGPAWDLGLVERTLIAGRAVWFYAGKLLWPANLTFIYPRWDIDAGSALAYVYPLLAIAVVAVLWSRRSKIGRGPLVAVLFFGGTLFPALGFADVYPFLFSFVADHFQYLASAGVIALLAAGLAALASGLAARPGASVVAPTLVVLLLSGLGSLTWAQASTYRDANTLWETTLERNPNAWIAHFHLGVAHFAAGEPERGFAKYDRAIELKPDFADAYNNRGSEYLERGEVGRAIEDYSHAIESQSDHLLALTNRGGAYQRIGRLDLTRADFERVVELAPESAPAHLNLAIAHAHSAQYQRAVEVYAQAIELAPEVGQAHWRRCESLRRLQRHHEALKDCDEGVRLDPESGWAHLARARLRFALGRLDSARDDVATARRQGAVVRESFVDSLDEPSGDRE